MKVFSRAPTILAALLIAGSVSAQDTEYWEGEDKAYDQTCTIVEGVWDDLCYAAITACMSHVAPAWRPLESYSFTANRNSDGTIKDYDCYVDPVGLPNPGTFFVNRVCWDGSAGVISNFPCEPEVYTGLGRPPCEAAVANPVNVTNGNKFEEVVDFATAGPNVLALRRTYNSQIRNQSETFGFGWRTNYDRSVFIASNGVNGYVYREDGRTLQFVKSGGVWSLASGNANIDFALAEITGGYEVTTPNEVIEEYDSDGLLVSITKPNGYEQTLTYNVDDKLIEVSDSYSRSITFTYLTSRPYIDTITDPDGQVYTYQYTEDPSRISAVVYPDNSQLTYLYEDADYPVHLTGIVDENGTRFATWTYDDLGRAISSEHAGGVDETNLTFNVNGTVTVENAYGKDAIYTMATVQSIPRVTEIAGQASANCVAADTELAYDSNGYVDSITDREGNVSEFVNDTRGLPNSLTEADATAIERTITTTWHATYRKPTQIVAPDLTTDFTYDSDGNLLTRTEEDTTTHTVPYVTDGETRTWTYTYSTTGQLLTVDGPLSGTGDTTTYAYDSSGFVSTITNALSQVTTINTVNGRGQPTDVTDANGIDTEMAYTPRGWLNEITVNPGASESVTRFEHDLVGQIITIVDPTGMRAYFTYDDAHRLIGIANDLGDTIDYTVDVMGNITKEETRDPSGTLRRSLTRTFDELGRLLTLVGAGGQTTDYEYNKNDQLTEVTDPRSNATGYGYDALTRLITMTDALTNDVDYGLDAANNLEDLTDTRNNVTSFVHNGFGDVIRRDSPDTGITDYVYDAAGNLTKMTDARSVVVDYAYDNLYRLTTATYPASTGENATYTYDQITGGNEGVGRLTKIEDESGSTAFVYDARGNVTSETRVIQTETYVTAYAYDAANRPIEITYPSGRVVSYTYDQAGQITEVATQKTSSDAAVIVAGPVQYRPFGPIASLGHGNAITTTFTYDNDYRLTALDATDGTTAVQDLDYVYGNLSGDAGNIRSITDNLNTALNQDYDYDVLYRLTDADGDYGDIDYAYDAAGNRTSRAIADGGTVTETSTIATGSNRLLSINDGSTTRTLSYAANGNITGDTRDAGFDYSYNNANRLVTLEENSVVTAEYLYNEMGQRVVKDLGSGDVTHYHFDRSGALIAESDEAGVLVREYIHINGLPIAVVDPGTSSTPAEINIDNTDAGASSSGGTWTLETAGTGYEGINYAQRVNGTGTATFTWQPTIATANVYQVHAKWPELAVTASSVTYTVHHANGTTDVTANQNDRRGEWVLLGMFEMEPSQNHRVVLSDLADAPSHQQDIIIDNDEPGTVRTGRWITRTSIIGGQFYDADYERMDVANTGASFTYPNRVAEPGQYRVYARWVQSSGYASDADYTVHHEGGDTTVTVDQQSYGAVWNLLGTFSFEPGSDPIVTVDGFDNNGWLMVDAIRLVRTQEVVEDIVIDNLDPAVTFSGTWSTGTATSGGLPYGPNYRIANKSGSFLRTATFAIGGKITEAETYRIYARWVTNTSGSATDAPYTVHHDGGSTTIDVNQKTNRATWVLLGAFDLTPASNPRVVLSNQANGSVRADAIRVVRQVTAETEFVVDNADAGTSQTGTWGTFTTYGSGIYYDTNYLTASGGAGANAFTWPIDVTAAGTYQVYARWTGNNSRNTAAEFTVHRTGGSDVISVNQQLNPGIWISLGLFDLAPSQSDRVVLTDAGDGLVAADAVRVVPVEYDSVPVYADAILFTANDAQDVLTVHASHISAPQKLTDPDRTVVWDANFLPFGSLDNSTGAANDNQRFPGQYFDAESGFHYNRYRDYDPTLGRYIQADPIGLAGGLNVYPYARGNPVRFVDPDGEQVRRVIPGSTGSGAPSVMPDVEQTIRDAERLNERWSNPAGLVSDLLALSEFLDNAGQPGAGMGVLGAIWMYCQPDDDPCYIRWQQETSRCLARYPAGGNLLRDHRRIGCITRANARYDMCKENNGNPNPGEPDEWGPRDE